MRERERERERETGVERERAGVTHMHVVLSFVEQDGTEIKQVGNISYLQSSYVLNIT